MKDPAWWKSVIGGSWVPEQNEMARRPDGPLLCREPAARRRPSDHEGRGQFPSRRRDLLRHGHLAGRPGARDQLYAERDARAAGRRRANKAHIYDIQPQMWTYEKTAEGGTQPYRAFVSIPGHLYKTFEQPHYRAILLRGIAWAGKRAEPRRILQAGGTLDADVSRGRPAEARPTRSRISKSIPTSTSRSSPRSR